MIITYENDSIESYQEMLVNVKIKDLEVLQLSNGTHKDNARVMLLPNLRLSLHSKNENVLFHKGIISADEFIITLNTDSLAHIVNGVGVGIDELNITAPNEYVYSKSICAYSAVTIGALKSQLMNYLGEEKVTTLMKTTALIRGGKIDLWKMKTIKKKLNDYILKILQCNKVLSYQATIDVELTIYTMLCELLEINTETSTLQQGVNNRFEIVKRAISYIDAESAINIPIPNIIKFSFCSLRSLEYAFNAILGISPQRYLKIRRMHLIRTELACREKVTIKDIVTKYGIVNTGRFSKDFYTLFGQYPKQT